VVAGVLFTGIVLVVSIRGKSDSDEFHRVAALEVMMAALLAMLVSSFLFSASGGETICQRSSFGYATAGALFAAAGAATFQALAWMLMSFEPGNSGLSMIAGFARFLVCGLAIGHIYLTIDDLASWYPQSRSLDVSNSLFAIAGALILVGAVVFWWTVDSSRHAPRSTIGAYVLLGTTAFAVGAYDVIASLHIDRWEADSAPPGLTLGVAILLTGCLGSIGISMTVGPRRRPAPPRIHEPPAGEQLPT
jgi:hypothetical protein